MARRILSGIAAVILLAACGTTSGSDSTSRASTSVPDSAPPTTIRRVNVVATAIVPSVAVYENPGAAEPIYTLENPAPPYGTPLVFFVREQRDDWLDVAVPVRPNGSTGWVRTSDVELTTHDFRMLVELGARRLTVWEGDRVVAEEPIGIGADTAPTPPGTYYTRELLQPENPDGAYGPYAYGLSGYSEVIFDFTNNGVRGDGRLAIHGTNQPESIGQSEGNGCIRISNDAVTALAGTLPIGVPVEIRS
ncbi:MAG: L,D-transpeptidase family protein [Acidimicrobiales bacterium]